ncbi:hypothetical protein DPEC_G00165650 [Dallia pectoralis]|uniref:Uncharacterized protein n=1 Tax=Dallia pectoralis TaxID=75939 RepID=A0ACC2GHC6_DALPE|nr:hypothetical protein DPEC_G00165650 [Dallia pectoralis]
MVGGRREDEADRTETAKERLNAVNGGPQPHRTFERQENAESLPGTCPRNGSLEPRHCQAVTLAMGGFASERHGKGTGPGGGSTGPISTRR